MHRTRAPAYAERMAYSLALDHLAVAARTLEEGVSYVEAVLGAEMSPGGAHARMGTHNRLLSLGRTYLEVIAVDPDAPAPPHRRWFGLDAWDGAPRLTNWIARTDDLSAALREALPGSGAPMEMSRGTLSWRITVTEFGRLPFDDAAPALIQWDAGGHPAARLPDHDLRLERLDVFHPRADEMLNACPMLARVGDVAIRTGPEKRLIATIRTPDGNRILA